MKVAALKIDDLYSHGIKKIVERSLDYGREGFTYVVGSTHTTLILSDTPAVVDRENSCIIADCIDGGVEGTITIAGHPIELFDIQKE
jgi:hypothetical protein